MNLYIICLQENTNSINICSCMVKFLIFFLSSTNNEGYTSSMKAMKALPIILKSHPFQSQPDKANEHQEQTPLIPFLPANHQLSPQPIKNQCGAKNKEIC